MVRSAEAQGSARQSPGTCRVHFQDRGPRDVQGSVWTSPRPLEAQQPPPPPPGGQTGPSGCPACRSRPR